MNFMSLLQNQQFSVDFEIEINHRYENVPPLYIDIDEQSDLNFLQVYAKQFETKPKLKGKTKGFFLSGNEKSLKLAQDNVSQLNHYGFEIPPVHSITDNDYSNYKEALSKMKQYERENGKFDLIVSIGGARPEDIAKKLAYETDLPLYAVATVISSDALASPNYVMKDNHEKFTSSQIAVPPLALNIDKGTIEVIDKYFIERDSNPFNSPYSSALAEVAAKRGEIIDFEMRAKNGRERYSLDLVQQGYQTLLKFPKNQIREQSGIHLTASVLTQFGNSYTILGGTESGSNGNHDWLKAYESLMNKPSKEVYHGHGVFYGDVIRAAAEQKFDPKTESPSPKELLILAEKFGIPTDAREAGFGIRTAEDALELTPHVRPERLTQWKIWDQKGLLTRESRKEIIKDALIFNNKN